MAAVTKVSPKQIAVTVAGILAVVVVLWGVNTLANRPQTVQIVPLPAEFPIKVAVRGAVRAPGVYTLQDGDRIEDALKLAGGFADDAEELAVNPAARLRDEQEIIVPRLLPTQTTTFANVPAPVGEATAAPAVPTQAPPTRTPTRVPISAPAVATRGRVNINTATAAELVAVPGIADLTASRIIQSRQQQRFNSIDELLSRGIMNQQNFDRARDLLGTS